VKLLFLSANPVNVVTQLRPEEELREIKQEVRRSARRDQLEIVSELAVRVRDLEDALELHKPDIVHFSGHGNHASEIFLEDEDGTRKAIDRDAICELFRLSKGNIRVVVLNACHAKDQAAALSKTIDFTIGMNDVIDDKVAIVFAARFYKSLAFGCSVQEAFDRAVNRLRLERFDAARVPILLVREGVDAAQSRIVKKSPPWAFLPWLLASLALSLTTDVLRRFLGDDGGWWDSGAVVAQAVLITAAVLTATLIAASQLRPAQPLVVKAAGLGFFNEPRKARRATAITLLALAAAFGAWLSLPVFARAYNEKGVGFQYREAPDLSRAREAYRLAVRLKPNFAQAHYNLATVNEDWQPEKAMDEYLLAIRYDSRIYPAYNNLARLYLLRGKDNDYDSALKFLNQAGDLAPQDENVQYSLNKNLGWAHYALKHYALAETYLRRAISLQNQAGAAHCLLAYVLREQGKAGVVDECYDCVSFAPGEKDVEAKWVSDAQECLMNEDRK
jgi:tetratricopeptide (TPR) repeat protein